jgi:hypothetical protein
MIVALQNYSESTTNAKWLVALTSRISNTVAIPDAAHEVRPTYDSVFFLEPLTLLS